MSDLYQTIRRPIFGQAQKTAYTGTAGVHARPIPPGAGAVYLFCTTAAYVKFSASGSPATTADFPVVANVPVILPVEYPTYPGSETRLFVSAVQDAAGGNLVSIPLVE